MELALAHYGACEAMQLPEPELTKIGEHVSQRIMGTFLGTVMRSSRHMGAGAVRTPSCAAAIRRRLVEREQKAESHLVTMLWETLAMR